MSALVMSSPAPEMTDAQLDQILADKNIMQRHLRCALSQGPCDPVGRRLRSKFEHLLILEFIL